jgi:hypothetical protein
MYIFLIKNRLERHLSGIFFTFLCKMVQNWIKKNFQPFLSFRIEIQWRQNPKCAQMTENQKQK